MICPEPAMPNFPPNSIEDWTLDALLELARQGYSETDRFEFKQVLIAKQGKGFAGIIRKAACSFANSRGGFLVFGVSEAGGGDDRVIGIPTSRENVTTWQAMVAPIEPSLGFRVKQPSISLASGTEVLVVEIQPSLRGPCWDPAERRFLRRGHGKCIDMSHEEVRMMYVNHEERLGRIKLVYLALIDNWFRLEAAIRPYGPGGGQIPLANLELAPIRSHLSDVQSLCPELLIHLLVVLRECDAIHARLGQVAMLTHAPYNEQTQRVKQHKDDIRSEMRILKSRFNWILKQLVDKFQFEPVYLDGVNLVKIPPIPECWPA